VQAHAIGSFFMTLPHLLNILVHVLAGTAAIVLGLYVLRTQQNRPRHRRLGRLSRLELELGTMNVLVARRSVTGHVQAADLIGLPLDC
jgi:hypothetical protein